MKNLKGFYSFLNEDLGGDLEKFFFPIQKQNLHLDIGDIIDNLSLSGSASIGMGSISVKKSIKGYKVRVSWSGNMGNNEDVVNDRLKRIHPDLTIDNIKKIADTHKEEGEFDYFWKLSAILPLDIDLLNSKLTANKYNL